MALNVPMKPGHDNPCSVPDDPIWAKDDHAVVKEMSRSIDQVPVERRIT